MEVVLVTTSHTREPERSLFFYGLLSNRAGNALRWHTISGG